MPAFCIVSTFLASLPAKSQPSVPLQPTLITWVEGPTEVPLGNKASLTVPASYQFTGKDAGDFLRQSGNDVPKGLLGCMTAGQGGRIVVLEYEDIGFLKDPTMTDVKPEDVLKVFATRATQKAKATKTTWELEPAYDATTQTFEYAFRMEIGKGTAAHTMLNYTTGFLGRHGVLLATTVYQGFTDLESLRLLTKSVRFNPGEAYTDYTSGDQISKLNLAQFLTKEPDVEAKAGQSSRLLVIGQAAFWTGLGIFVVASMVALALVVKRGRQQQAAAPAPAVKKMASPTPATTPTSPTRTISAPPAEAVTAAPVSTPAPAANAPSQPAAPPKPKPAPAPITAKPRTTFVAKSLNGAKRRREFDYNRYFADLMSTVSGHGATTENPQMNGYPVELGQLMPAAALPVSGSAPGTSPAFNANAELIANQTTLIEEQRRLIQEQTKLIEEKSRLIAEKNQLLKLQRELMDNKIL